MTTPRGLPVLLDGTGLYRWSGVFAAAGQRGTDLVVVVLVVPLLVIALVAARRGAVRARLLLAGLLVVVVYVHGSPYDPARHEAALAARRPPTSPAGATPATDSVPRAHRRRRPRDELGGRPLGQRRPASHGRGLTLPTPDLELV
ncbi:hypothetical protein PHK61_31530 [Actinomycetospora lutea]|uniref:hypothetical protein n=1 Tax=Actinomycetospora lutea TaxID=663604 RepID=UPI002366EFE4|nr:hypothetical protein [Actinomycetospora lutea]MDD7942948.1 hypothetical protein [Actinomycetospora lutea]